MILFRKYHITYSLVIIRLSVVHPECFLYNTSKNQTIFLLVISFFSYILRSFTVKKHCSKLLNTCRFSHSFFLYRIKACKYRLYNVILRLYSSESSQEETGNVCYIIYFFRVAFPKRTIPEEILLLLLTTDPNQFKKIYSTTNLL